VASYAKHIAAWPESGLRYAASFALEYGVWVWLLIAMVWVGTALVARVRARKVRIPSYAGTIAVGVVAAHAAYYTLFIGGDHFEYRVYSHLIPLLFLSALWMSSRLTSRAGLTAAMLVTFIAAAQAIPWTHWSETRHLETRAETRVMIRPIVHRFPRPLRPMVAPWDELQAWLIRHHVGMRHQEHKVFYEWMTKLWGTREEGSRIRWDQRAVVALWTVGVAGWVLPEVAIIDRFGLNDRVIARAPPRHGDAGDRLMAHERQPPPGYIECFRPNLRPGGGRIQVDRRILPLTDDEIRACESRDWL
jgi:arabinofuranosyltransferase